MLTDLVSALVLLTPGLVIGVAYGLWEWWWER